MFPSTTSPIIAAGNIRAIFGATRTLDSDQAQRGAADLCFFGAKGIINDRRLQTEDYIYDLMPDEKVYHKVYKICREDPIK